MADCHAQLDEVTLSGMTQALTTDTSGGWLVEALAEELRVQLARKRVSGRELARRLHVSAQWVSQRTKGDVPLRIDEIERICDALSVSPIALLSAAANATAQDATNRRYDGDIEAVVIPFPQVRETRHPQPNPALSRAGETRATA